jgi:membrane associated rhomboid family serine protease
MLEDRDYMREPTYGARWSLTTILLVVNVVVFVLQKVAHYYLQPFLLERYLALSIRGLQAGYFWQPLTFQFLHSGLFHLLANLITIYFFGRPLEASLGRKQFLKIYFGGGVFGGLLQLFAALVMPGHFGVAGVVGASAGAFGLVAAFAMLYPEQRLTLLLFFVIPFSLRAKFLLLFAILLAVFGVVVPYDNIAHVAHLGGILVGVALTWRGNANWMGWPRRKLRPVSRPRELAVAPNGPARWREPKLKPLEDLPSEEFISKEVDPILDKINAQGFQSLTPRERRILEAASAKIHRR